MLRPLVPHPDTPGPALQIEAGLRSLGGDLISFQYRLHGAVEEIALPRASSKPPQRKDALWQTTCFEAFARNPGGDGYREFNFSPSGDWACYEFEAYRAGMGVARVKRELVVAVMPAEEMLVIEGIVAGDDLVGATKLALAAVIEERSGRKSYWALAHAPGKADFHHPDSFILELPANP